MSTLLRQALAKLKKNNGSCSSFSLTQFEDDYELLDVVLNETSTYKTLLGVSVEEEEKVTVKIVSKKGLTRSSLRRLVNEVKVLRQLTHENIVRVHDIYDKPDAIYIVSEYIQGKTLSDRIVDESFDFTENDCRFVLQSLVGALKYCKEQGVVHRNITPDNIVFSTNAGKHTVKIIDFQYSKQLEKEAMDFSLLQTMCGTPNFVAPEVLKGRTYNYKCDVWSMGVILYLILSGGYLPFSSSSRDSISFLFDKIKKGQWEFQPANAWANISEDAIDLVKQMLVLKPDARFSYEQILAHRFFIEQPTRSFRERGTVLTIRSTMTSTASKRFL